MKKKFEVEIATTEGEKKILLLTQSELDDLESEMAGEKNYIQEYETKDRDIITDLEIEDILDIVEVVKIKKGGK